MVGACIETMMRLVGAREDWKEGGGGGQQIEEKKKAASVCVYIYRDIIEGTKETIRPKRSSRAFTDLTRRGRIGARSTPSEPAATRRRN